MPAGAVLTIIIVCVLIAIAAGTAATLELRLLATRRQFGPEYDRLARQVGPRRARAELIVRKRHVAGLDLRPLPPQRSRELLSQWDSVQEHFVEAPAEAVTTAAELVLSAASERGYPAGDREQLLADLSVAHPRQLDSFRRAEQTAADLATASTEDLRQAVLGYRALFYELTAGRSSAGRPDAGRSSAGRPDAGRSDAPVSGGRRLPWAGAIAGGALARKARRPPTQPQPQPRGRAPRVRLATPRLRLRTPRLPRVPHPNVPRLGRGSRPSKRQGANQA